MSFQTLLASAARTASQTTPQTGSINSQSDTGKTVTLVFDVSAVPGTDTVQLVVEHIDQAGRVIAAFTAAARVAVGTDIVILGEGQPVLTPASAAGGVRHSAPIQLGQYRCRVVHSAGTSFTYSLTASD
jgi:hypothetical protein